MSVGGARSDQDGLIQQGRGLLAANKPKPALARFKEASLRCACNKTLIRSSQQLGLSLTDIPIPICHCKDFMSLTPDNEDNQAMYKLAKKPCTCGSGITSCSSQGHIDALNGMIAIFEKLKAYGKAYKYASLLVIVAPHAPEGYLRMAKVLRLQDPSNGPDTKTRCAWIYSQANESVRAFGDKKHGKLKALGSLIRKDIIIQLPPEIQEMILKLLPYKDLCRSMRVSKAWNAACRSRALWRHLEFEKRWSSNQPRPFRPGALNDIISRRSQNMAQSLTIAGMRDFDIDYVKLGSILKALPHLQNLSLYGFGPKTSLLQRDMDKSKIPSFKKILTVVCQNAPSGLQALHLGGFHHNDRSDSWSPPATIRFATSLRELSLTNLAYPEFFLELLCTTVWPSIEKLMVKGITKYEQSGTLRVDYVKIMKAMPSLKDLSLHGVQAMGQRTFPRGWCNLERFVIDHPRYILNYLFPPSTSLRSLELHSQGLRSLHLLRNAYAHSGSATPFAFGELEHFLSHEGPVYHEISFPDCIDLVRVIEPSLKNGTLHSLDIFFDPDLYDPVIQDYKANIHMLSCSDIAMPSIIEGGPRGQVDDFLDWIDGFPNLTTLGVYPHKTEDAWMVVAKVVNRLGDGSRLRRIYTNVLVGAYRDQVLGCAAKKGVEIIHADRMPEPVLLLLPKGQRQ